ncbi:MAG TPA: hypothetical protein VMM78_17535 [Thermomicrobiales bacterium]|nr:hypothetical protein [Thermomicrobiales bacterium]
MPSIISEHTTYRRLLLGAAMIAVWWVIGWLLSVRLEGDYLAVMIALAFAIGVVGAHIIRSGWACVIVPLALLAPAIPIAAWQSRDLAEWLVGSLYVLLHYNLFVGIPAAGGAFIGWANQQPRRGGVA